MPFTAVYLEVPEGFIGFVEELPGVNTQGATLEETRENLQEAVQMVLEANRELSEKTLSGKKVVKEPFVLDNT
jgi:predicted RNase H-like HicB family nuclease